MKLIEKAGFLAVGVEVVSDWEGLHRHMPRAWSQFKERVQEIEHRVGDEMIDISLFYDGKLYTQFICVEVGDVAELPSGMVAHTIPSQTYIHATHRGPVQDIARTFGLMYDWAKAQGYKTSHVKIDRGYTSEGCEDIHELYVQVI